MARSPMRAQAIPKPPNTTNPRASGLIDDVMALVTGVPIAVPIPNDMVPITLAAVQATWPTGCIDSEF